MNTTSVLPGLESLVKPFKFAASPYEYKVTTLRECPLPENLQQCETPDKAADYWRLHIASHPHFNPDCECLAVLLLNTRRKVKGHHLVSIGTMDTILVHPREVFRLAILTAASAILPTGWCPGRPGAPGPKPPDRNPSETGKAALRPFAGLKCIQRPGRCIRPANVPASIRRVLFDRLSRDC